MVSVKILASSHCVSKLAATYLRGGHGQEGGDPQGDPCRHRLVVNPEGEPRDKDDHGGRHVDCEDEEGQLPWFKRNIDKLYL